MANLALGIDTGGTLTDGVLFDLDRKAILAKSKVSTAQHDLARSIESCLDHIMARSGDIDPAAIKMVSLSTTLATNSIVEGRGGEVGLLMIGFSDPVPKLPTSFVASLRGGCDLKGESREELDLAAAGRAIADMNGQVDAFAVSGYLSIRNPAQELAVAALVHELTGRPAVCAHELSRELGFYERTVTAVLNARLIPLVTALIAAVKESIESRGINAPLLVVKGDGSLVSDKKALERPVETILSGPAASIIGAVALTGVKDAVVVDMGGTTTDLAVLRQGCPVINSAGAQVGEWFTRVRAADITTVGLGGDSLISVDREGILSIGPQRAYPLSAAAAQYPHLSGELAEIKEHQYALFSAVPAVVLLYLKEPSHQKLTAAEKQILSLVRESPHTIHHIGKQMDWDFDLLPWQRLARLGAVLPSAMTPTDILHLSGAYLSGDREAARWGAKILARRFKAGVEELIDAVLEEIYFQVAALIAGRLVLEKVGSGLNFAEKYCRFFLKEMLESEKGKGPIDFSARLNLPLIAVGAPVGAYFPEIAKRLGAEILVPPSAEVANAVGTVSGQILERVRILIRPDGEEFIVHAPWGREICPDLEKAAAGAVEAGKRYLSRQAAASGMGELEISIDRKDHLFNYGQPGDDGAGKGGAGPEQGLYLETVIEILAAGRPWR